MPLTPDDVQDLVTLAFCLEPLAEKEGCTNRVVDLPGKPLTDFLIAGINVGKYFRMLAQDVARHPHADIFGYHLVALQHTNRYKTPKTVNLGLLEIFFPVVYARLIEDDPNKVIPAVVMLMQRENVRDVQSLVDAWLEAWKTSTNERKRSFTGDGSRDARSPFELYMQLMKIFPKDSASYQWSDEYKNGLPTLTRIFAELQKRGADPLHATAQAYHEIQREQPHLKKGIIADMCAAALFLWYSFRQ